ncbi:hypothetical protein RRG08_056702 [Elysia crispata]|uniref:Uncharacterized protein n=1 Tax=Elysia crispata TaxID=231223 RepID=A0AAE1E585_9GAST|nr:hypothetical protein RRG08_056702 [Elysia crispata]
MKSFSFNSFTQQVTRLFYLPLLPHKMSRSYVVALMACLLVVALLPGQSEAGLRRVWRRVMRAGNSVANVVTNPEDAFNSLVDTVGNIDWADPDTYTYLFSNQGCDKVCPACTWIPEAASMATCMTYCVTRCDWEYL